MKKGFGVKNSKKVLDVCFLCVFCCTCTDFESWMDTPCPMFCIDISDWHKADKKISYKKSQDSKYRSKSPHNYWKLHQSQSKLINVLFHYNTILCIIIWWTRYNFGIPNFYVLSWSINLEENINYTTSTLLLKRMKYLPLEVKETSQKNKT